MLIEYADALENLFFSYHFYELASLAILFSGLTLALLLGFAKRGDRISNLFLSSSLVVIILKTSGLAPFLLPALGPILYFYVRHLTQPDRKFHRKDLLHFCPSLAGFWIPGWLISISVIIYLFLSHQLIQNFYSRLRPVLMDRPRFAFRRLDKVLALFGLLCVLSLFSEIFYFIIALVFFGMAIEAILKPDGDVQLTTPITDRSDARDKGRRLKEAVAINRFYEDAELTLATLAAKLSLHPHDLSRIINVGLEKNFSDFINEFRVREVARKMQAPVYDHLTLLGIAYESGFNSQRTFNRVFKEMTGKTPVEYKSGLKKELPIDKLATLPRIRTVILRSESPPTWAPGKLNRNYMFRNHLKIAWRSLIVNKVYSGINVLGLATGMAVAVLIGLWIWNETTFDRSFANHKQLAQIMTNSTRDDGTLNTDPLICQPIAGELRTKYGSDFKNISMSRWNQSALMISGKTITAIGLWVEDKFPTMLSLNMMKGNINALTDPSSIIISASLAKTLFGDDDPIGKIIKLDNKDNFKVAGVFRDFPNNRSVIRTDSFPNLQDATYFLPWKKYITADQWVKDAAMDWQNHSWQCYVQLADNINVDEETKKIKNVVMAHKTKGQGIESAYLYPMDKWHLYSEFKNGKPVGGLIQFVWLFAIIGVFVLLLACINFMNLSTARSEKRAKEVGIRKTVGSLRGQLIRQFLSESVLVAFVSFIFSIVLVILLLPLFNSLAGKNIQLPWRNPVFWLCTLAFTCFTGLLSGSYPALYLSRFEPIKVLKGTFRVGRYASLPRKVLVVAQFTFSIALIIGTVVVFKQIQFAKNRPVNYRTEGLITVSGVTQDLPRFYDAVRNDLLATGVVDNMCGASDATTNLGAWRTGFNWEGKNPNTLPSFGFMYMTEDFGRTIGWKLKEGRDFSKDFSTDSLAMILNESAVKQVGMKKDIVGQNIQYDGKNYRVIGVVKDIVQESPYKPVTPMVYLTSHNWIGCVTVAIKTGVPVRDALTKIEKTFKKYNPTLPFNYTFNDEDYAKKFADEERIGKLATFFTVLAIFISCLGLFGLASFVAEQRKKEIGVRKVLGASTYRLWQMLSKEFAWLVIISCFIAMPLAWYYANNWLRNYDYKTSISVWVFVASGAGALAITLITVSFQSIKAALANPVKSLRSE
ncbi:MAG TPA: ABC transporter permease [Mucilaginibacter sp.]|nr:ABC transporter permease [Mucilaginibacter sp.]